MASQTSQPTPDLGDENGFVKAEMETLSKDLSRRLAASVKIKDTFELTDDRDKLNDFVSRVRTEHDELQKSRRRRKRRIGARVSRLCANMSRLLSHYAGIAELMKSVDSRAGPLAYGAIAVSLSLVAQKAELEEMMALGLEKISDWLRDVGDYETIWKESSTLKILLYRVYIKVLGFVVRIWDYSSGTSKSSTTPELSNQKHHKPGASLKACADIRQGRMLTAFKRPPKFDLAPQLDGIKDAVDMVVVESKKEHQRLDVTQWRIEEERRQRQWQNAVASLRASAQCPVPLTPHQFLERLQEYSAGDDDGSQSDEDRASQLIGDPSFKWWFKCRHSCILLLTPHNGPDSSPTPDEPLWTSPIISKFAADVPGKQKHSVFYHPINNQAPRPSSLVALIICDILERDEDLFKNMGQQAQNLLKSDKFDELDMLDRYLNLLRELIRGWGERHGDTTFFIIFDRFHVYFRRDLASSSGGILPEAAIAMLQGLYRMLKGLQNPVVKVLIQVDAARREHVVGRFDVAVDREYLRFSGLLSP